jgi:hypothetical protein
MHRFRISPPRRARRPRGRAPGRVRLSAQKAHYRTGEQCSFSVGVLVLPYEPRAIRNQLRPGFRPNCVPVSVPGFRPQY